MQKRRLLAHRRKAVGLSQDELAEQLGVERSTVMRWETGRTEPRPWLRGMLAEALKVTMDQLDDLLHPSDDTELARHEEATPVHRREFASLATGLPLAPLMRPRLGSRLGASDVRHLIHRTARLRRLDDILGGMDTYRIYLSEERRQGSSSMTAATARPPPAG